MSKRWSLWKIIMFEGDYENLKFLRSCVKNSRKEIFVDIEWLHGWKYWHLRIGCLEICYDKLISKRGRLNVKTLNEYSYKMNTCIKEIWLKRWIFVYGTKSNPNWFKLTIEFGNTLWHNRWKYSRRNHRLTVFTFLVTTCPLSLANPRLRGDWGKRKINE